MNDLVLRDANSGEQVTVTPTRLVVVGFSGRAQEHVRAHVEELAALGVPVPERVPSFYVLEPAALVVTDRVEVAGTFTSGEVEPVLIFGADRTYLGVGSDHTDRALETEGILPAKQACPKVIGSDVVALDEVVDWDQVRLTSWADDQPYQDGTLAEILPIDAIRAAAAAEGITLGAGDVAFLGTIPVIGQLRPATGFRAQLVDGSTELTLAYQTVVADPASPADAAATAATAPGDE